jgi:hypothetical protein
VHRNTGSVCVHWGGRVRERSSGDLRANQVRLSVVCTLPVRISSPVRSRTTLPFAGIRHSCENTIKSEISMPPASACAVQSTMLVRLVKGHLHCTARTQFQNGGREGSNNAKQEYNINHALHVSVTASDQTYSICQNMVLHTSHPLTAPITNSYHE